MGCPVVDFTSLKMLPFGSMCHKSLMLFGYLSGRFHTMKKLRCGRKFHEMGCPVVDFTFLKMLPCSSMCHRKLTLFGCLIGGFQMMKMLLCGNKFHQMGCPVVDLTLMKMLQHGSSSGLSSGGFFQLPKCCLLVACVSVVDFKRCKCFVATDFIKWVVQWWILHDA
jgi:hypothetical protein